MKAMVATRSRRTMIAGTLLASSLALVGVTASATPPTPETVYTTAQGSQAVLLISSRSPQRNPDLSWDVDATIVSNCVSDPGIRTCGVLNLRLIYRFASPLGPATGRDTRELESPLDDAAFQMPSTTVTYKFYAWQEVCGPLGCAKAETSDPFGGGTYSPT